MIIYQVRSIDDSGRRNLNPHTVSDIVCIIAKLTPWVTGVLAAFAGVSDAMNRKQLIDHAKEMQIEHGRYMYCR